MTGENHHLEGTSSFLQDREQPSEATSIGGIEHVVQDHQLAFVLGEDLAKRQASYQEELFLLAALEVVQFNRFGQGFGLNAGWNKLVGQANGPKAWSGNAREHPGGSALDRSGHGSDCGGLAG